MDEGRRAPGVELTRLCARHRLALVWADLMDGVPPEEGDFGPSARLEVLARAAECVECLRRSGRSAGSWPSSYSPTLVWNPTSVGPPPTHGFGDLRDRTGRRPQPRLSAAWLVGGVCLVSIVLGGLAMASWPGSGRSRPQAHQAQAHAQPAVGVINVVGDLEDADELRVGDCLRTLDLIDDQLDVVDCATDVHRGEVFAVFTLAAQPWPGQKAVDRSSMRGCDLRFERYVGVSSRATSLDTSLFDPSRAGWRADDRLVTCLVAEGSTPRLGSLRHTYR
jgi:hypothetical protein